MKQSSWQSILTSRSDFCLRTLRQKRHSYFRLLFALFASPFSFLFAIFRATPVPLSAAFCFDLRFAITSLPSRGDSKLFSWSTSQTLGWECDTFGRCERVSACVRLVLQVVRSVADGLLNLIRHGPAEKWLLWIVVWNVWSLSHDTLGASR